MKWKRKSKSLLGTFFFLLSRSVLAHLHNLSRCTFGFFTFHCECKRYQKAKIKRNHLFVLAIDGINSKQFFFFCKKGREKTNFSGMYLIWAHWMLDFNHKHLFKNCIFSKVDFVYESTSIFELKKINGYHRVKVKRAFRDEWQLIITSERGFFLLRFWFPSANKWIVTNDVKQNLLAVCIDIRVSFGIRCETLSTRETTFDDIRRQTTSSLLNLNGLTCIEVPFAFKWQHRIELVIFVRRFAVVLHHESRRRRANTKWIYVDNDNDIDESDRKWNDVDKNARTRNDVTITIVKPKRTHAWGESQWRR